MFSTFLTHIALERFLFLGDPGKKRHSSLFKTVRRAAIVPADPPPITQTEYIFEVIFI